MSLKRQARHSLAGTSRRFYSCQAYSNPAAHAGTRIPRKVMRDGRAGPGRALMVPVLVREYCAGLKEWWIITEATADACAWQGRLTAKKEK